MSTYTGRKILVDLSKLGDFPKNTRKIVVRSKNKHNLHINQDLVLTNELLRGLYMVLGDGSLCKGVYFSNINYRLHNEFMKVFNSHFNIPKRDFIVSLTVNYNFDFKQIKKAALFWMKVLDLDKIQRFYLTDFNTFHYGGVKIIYDNKQLSVLLKNIFCYTNSLIYNRLLDSRQLCFVLDGVLNAEGSANIDKDKWGLHKISISFNRYNEEEKQLFFGILTNLGLQSIVKVTQKRRYEVSRWYNQYKFIKVFVTNNVLPFSLSPKRAIKLLWGFLNHQRTKSVCMYLKVINKKESQTFSEITNSLNYNKSSVNSALLRKFKRFGFFVIEKPGRAYKVSITEEGQLFLRMIQKLNIWLNKVEDMYFEDLKLLEEVGMREDLLPFERIQRKVIVKVEGETNPHYGVKPDERSVEQLISYGVINLNKPSGPT